MENEMTAEGGELGTTEPTQEAVGGEQNGQVAFTLEDGTPVTVEEAKNGYLRQKDYTQKTQEVAQTRKDHEADLALAQWINENPVEAVDWLEQQIAPLREGNVEPDEIDPIQAEIDELRGFVTEQRQNQQEAAILAEMNRLQKDIGTFDPDELLAHAVERNIPDLEVALIHMNAVKGRTSEAADAAARQRAKDGLPPVDGRSGSSATPATKKNPSVSEALQETMREFGIDRLPPIDD